MKEREAREQNNFLCYKLLYKFRSRKSNQWYIVWVEVYKDDFYAIKFHLKAHSSSKMKYSIMTNLFEVRPVINTCIAILLDIYRDNPNASFGFIGSNMNHEPKTNTKRFRIYSKFVANYFSVEKFKHYFNLLNSTYILVNKEKINKDSSYILKLEKSFKQFYDFME